PGLLVRERRREIVGGPARPLEHVAGVVRTVLDLVFGGESGRLRRRISGTAGFGEIAECDVGQAVTGRADFLVDLQAALQRSTIVLAKGPRERPLLRGRRVRMVLGARILGAAEEQTT